MSKMGIAKIDSALVSAMCDTYMCTNTADYQLGYEDNGNILDALNICDECLRKLKVAVNKIYRVKDVAREKTQKEVEEKEEIEEIEEIEEKEEVEIEEAPEGHPNHIPNEEVEEDKGGSEEKIEEVKTLEEMTYHEVKDYCIKNKIPCIGSREAMIQRIKEKGGNA